MLIGASWALVLAVACQPSAALPDAGASPAEQWAAARALWTIERDPAAYGAWVAIDPATPEGHEAQRLLRDAEGRYRVGIDQVRRGDPEARETFERAVRIAPMRPDLYLPLARAFRTQAELAPENPHLFIRAAEYYRKFLVLRPDHAEAARAAAELGEIDPDATRLLEAPVGEGRSGTLEPVAAQEPAGPSWPLVAALSALALALAALTVLGWRTRASLLDLEALAERRPELHPAIAYLVGGLRHELLKHRIGAVADAVKALVRGGASEAQQEFLQGRLFGGEPLDRAWEGHLRAFERALGPELDLRRSDRAFRRAATAIRSIAALEARLRRGDARAAARLGRSHAVLRELDEKLAQLGHRLVRTTVDGALLREVVDEVRSEYAAGRVALDEVAIRAPEPAPMVEVFRVDLVLVLKNVVRNAIGAVGRSEPPRRIGLDVETELEPTGEETVRIRVRDSSPERVELEDLRDRGVDRGLGLVTAALSRYQGALDVEQGEGAFAKAIVLRFFRAYTDDDAGPGRDGG
ncbi:MAG: hypothetical protein IT378_13855 [Sandaracinaceae bacterium]|nr:hypothetical protein [Sandaracinaceae bacterium]